MGTPIPPPTDPPPVSPGSACSVCWGSGKPFGDGDTPDQIFLSLSGIDKGPLWHGGLPEPPNGEFVLTQRIGSPCIFDTPIGLIAYNVGFFPTLTAVSILTIGPTYIFNGQDLIVCDTFLLNMITDYYVNGSALITIPEIE